jgi:hypothetical protein
MSGKKAQKIIQTEALLPPSKGGEGHVRRNHLGGAL